MTAPVVGRTQSSKGLDMRKWKLKHLARRFRLSDMYTPNFQCLLISFTFFFCVGVFNAISGLGGGGQIDPNANNDATVALYTTFAVCAFFAGPIVNLLGIRLSALIGSFTYCIYTASLLCYNQTRNKEFLITAGGLLGLGASLLWTTQGIIIISYPEEKFKGRYISIFVIVYNMGGTLGSLIPLFQNINSKQNSVGAGTYIGFLALTAVGCALTLGLGNLNDLKRDVNSEKVDLGDTTWKRELVELFSTLRTELYIFTFFPLFFSANWFFAYEFNDVNLARFDIRTRSLNSTLFFIAQMIGGLLFGCALDLPWSTRRTRAKVAVISMLVLTGAIWGGGFAFQKTYTRRDILNENFPKLDWTKSGYIGPAFLYFCYGAYTACFQTTIYWLLGLFSNGSRQAALFSGFYQSLQSAGAAISYRLDTLETPYLSMLWSSFGLCLASLIVVAPTVWLKSDRDDPKDDGKHNTDGNTGML